MKKIFMRAGALLMAAIVLVGAVVGVAPIQASAADNVVSTWDLNSSLSRLPDWPNLATYQYKHLYSISGTVYLLNGDAVVFDQVDLDRYYYLNSKTYFYFSVHRVGDSDDTWVDFYEYKEINAWLNDSQVSRVVFNSEPTGDNLISWLNLNATFQAPPPDPGPLVEVTQDLKEQNLLTQVLTGVLSIIPIGLACLVGYKGLRKALDLLRRMLHQA